MLFDFSDHTRTGSSKSISHCTQLAYLVMSWWPGNSVSQRLYGRWDGMGLLSFKHNLSYISQKIAGRVGKRKGDVCGTGGKERRERQKQGRRNEIAFGNLLTSSSFFSMALQCCAESCLPLAAAAAALLTLLDALDLVWLKVWLQMASQIINPLHQFEPFVQTLMVVGSRPLVQRIINLQRWARLVLGWETVQVLSECYC